MPDALTSLCFAALVWMLGEAHLAAGVQHAEHLSQAVSCKGDTRQGGATEAGRWRGAVRNGGNTGGSTSSIKALPCGRLQAGMRLACNVGGFLSGLLDEIWRETETYLMPRCARVEANLLCSGGAPWRFTKYHACWYLPAFAFASRHFSHPSPCLQGVFTAAVNSPSARPTIAPLLNIQRCLAAARPACWHGRRPCAR